MPLWNSGVRRPDRFRPIRPVAASHPLRQLRWPARQIVRFRPRPGRIGDPRVIHRIGRSRPFGTAPGLLIGLVRRHVGRQAARPRRAGLVIAATGADTAEEEVRTVHHWDPCEGGPTLGPDIRSRNADRPTRSDLAYVFNGLKAAFPAFVDPEAKLVPPFAATSVAPVTAGSHDPADNAPRPIAFRPASQPAGQNVPGCSKPPGTTPSPRIAP